MQKSADKRFKEKKVIILDFDGTLVNSLPDIAFCLNQMLLELKGKLVEEKIVANWIGNGTEKLVERALIHSLGSNELGLNYFDIQKALSIYMDYYRQAFCRKTFAYPGVINGLRVLKKAGFYLALVTNKPTEFILPILAELKFTNEDGNDLFEIILGGDALPQKKPDALPLLHVCTKLMVKASECVMVGDSRNDILAAQNANMHNIGVTYGYNYGESIENCAPDIICRNFEEVIKILLPSCSVSSDAIISN